MKLVVTGGGTGGHIYPALEIAKIAREEGMDVRYLGSLRGQEGSVSAQQGFDFKGFVAAPLYSLKQPRGWRSLALLMRATVQAKAVLKTYYPDAIFSTGGYSAAPVMAASKSLRLPLCIHESNSIPGRSNRLFASYCSGFSCAFEATLKVIPYAIRTGQPIRRELRSAAKTAHRGEDLSARILALGGSQGSLFLNDLVRDASTSNRNRFDWLLAAGKSNIAEEKMTNRLREVPYLETEELAHAYANCGIVVARSGGTLAEIAMFGVPSILIPLPTAADDHQTRNAEEFVRLGGAKLMVQADASVDQLLNGIEEWFLDPIRYQLARKALTAWDKPSATRSIFELVKSAARKQARRQSS